MDPRYSQDGERYTPPPTTSTSSSARQSFNRFRDSVPTRVSTLRSQIQALPDRFPQVTETLHNIPDKLQSVPARLQTLPDKLQTAGSFAQEQLAKLPSRPSSRGFSSSNSAPTSPVSDYSTTSSSSAPASTSTSTSTSAMAMRAPGPDDPAYDAALAALAGRILYRSGYDHESGGPLLVLCAASFPDARQVDYNKLLPYVLGIIPSDEELGPEEHGGSYSVVFFSGGGGMPGTGGTNNGGASVSQGNRPSWAWTLQAYNLLGRAVRKRIRRLWVVHEKAWVRILFEMMAGVVSVKFRKKVVHLNSLSDLANHLNITTLNIPPVVYFHDRKLSQTITIPTPPPPLFGAPPFHNAANPPRIGENMPLPQFLIDTSRYIRSKCLHIEGIFRVPPNSTLLDILREAVDRKQYLKLDEWGPHTNAALIKLYYRSLPEPIFPAECYDTLMSFTPATAGDDSDGDDHIFTKVKHLLLESEKDLLPPASRALLLKHLLPLLALVSQYAPINKMTPKNLAVCIAPSLIRSDDMVADAKASSGVRKFLEVAIERIEELAPRLPERPGPGHGRHSSNGSSIEFGINPPTPRGSPPPPPYAAAGAAGGVQRKKLPGPERRGGDGGVGPARKSVGESARPSMDGLTLVDKEDPPLSLAAPMQPQQQQQQQPVLTPPPVVYRRGSTPSASTFTASAAMPPPPPPAQPQLQQQQQQQDADAAPPGGIVLRRKASLQALAGGGGSSGNGRDEGTQSRGPSASSYLSSPSSSSSTLSPHNINAHPFLTRSLSVSATAPPRVVRRAVSSSFLPSSTTSFLPSSASVSPAVNANAAPSSSVAAIAGELNRAKFNPNQNLPATSLLRDPSPSSTPMVRAKTAELIVGNSGRSRSGTLISLVGGVGGGGDGSSRRSSVVGGQVPVVAVRDLKALYEERSKTVEVLVRTGVRGSVKGRWREK
ncbi:uncharacterized protein LAJ45_05374 [Morchella importuna]|uniref:uncharacterized protein n=1 Tax=Morchella importuna TaxID=1174673 RepID=UPI001E8E09A5|nr:uncharacterized protein LAJ45_05374 [Morchella importuna]KAH8150678.1 hypothetical protein LAJ45_05374 [Morchella importuna]